MRQSTFKVAGLIRDSCIRVTTRMVPASAFLVNGPSTITAPLGSSTHMALWESCESQMLRRSRYPAPRVASLRLQAKGPSVSSDGKAQKSSFYKRPSKAIEMGGGFFIPGLEGYRLRLSTSLLVIVLLVLNRFPGYDPTPTQAFSEYVGISAALILLIQALLDKGLSEAAERAAIARDSDAATDVSGLAVSFGEYSAFAPGAPLANEDADDNVRYAGYALSEVFPEAQVVILDRTQGLVYSKGFADGLLEKEQAINAAKALNSAWTASDSLQSEQVVLLQALDRDGSLRRSLGIKENSRAALVGRAAQRLVLVVAEEAQLMARRSEWVWLERAAEL